MGSYVNGVYVPNIGETGWGEEVNDFLTRSGEEYVNVKAGPYGALGDGTTDDTAAFVAAEAAAGTGGKLFIPTGTYRVNDWTPTTQRLTVQGAGYGSVLKAKAAATYAVVLQGMLHHKWSDLTIDGNSKASSGLKIVGGAAIGSQGHVFERVKFQNAIVGTKVDTGTVNQVDKNLFVGCHWDTNTTGLWINSPNAQNQTLVSCTFDTHTTALRCTYGGLVWIGGQVQTATTSFLIDGPFESIYLNQIYTEGGMTRDLDGRTAWPSLGVVADQCKFQGSTSSADCGQSSGRFIARNCIFDNAGFVASGNDTLFQDEYCTFNNGATWTQTGSANRRISVTNDGTYHYFDSTSYNRADVNAWGSYLEMKEMSAPPAGGANYGRIFMRDNGAGKTQLCVIFASGDVQVLATQP